MTTSLEPVIRDLGHVAGPADGLRPGDVRRTVPFDQPLELLRRRGAG